MQVAKNVGFILGNYTEKVNIFIYLSWNKYKQR